MSPLADWLPPVRFTKSLRLRLLLVSILVEGLMLSLLVANGARLIRSHLMESTELRLEAQESSFNIALAGRCRACWTVGAAFRASPIWRWRMPQGGWWRLMACR